MSISHYEKIAGLPGRGSAVVRIDVEDWFQLNLAERTLVFALTDAMDAFEKACQYKSPGMSAEEAHRRGCRTPDRQPDDPGGSK